MISAAVVAAVVGFVPATAQAAAPSTGPGRAADATAPAAGAAKGTTEQQEAAVEAATEQSAKDAAAGAEARTEAETAPKAAAAAPYFRVFTGSSTSNAHGMGMAAGVSTDLKYAVINYTVDWGDGTPEGLEFGMPGENVYLKHTFAKAGAHTVTVTATEPVGKLTDTTTFDVVVDGSEFTPYAPTRLLDTRDGTGAPAAGAVAAFGTTKVKVAGNGGIPAGVTAVALNLTATNAVADGHVIAYASGTKQPTTSNVNFTVGRTVPTLAIVPVGADGCVELANRSDGTLDLIADVTGYFSRTAANGYTSMKPARIADTREGRGTAQGPAAGQSTFDLQVAGEGGLPARGVAAVALNVTVTNPQGSGHLTVSPSGGRVPGTSNLNFEPGQTVANAVIVPVGPDGKVTVRNGSWSGADVIVDVTGYYSADGRAAYMPTEPTRELDDRTWGTGGVTGQNYYRHYVPQIFGSFDSVVMNVTVTNTQGGGHLSVAPDPNRAVDYSSGKAVRPTPPDSSVLNWEKGATVSNLVQASLRNTDTIDVWNRSWSPTNLIIDVFGRYETS
ncbi:PKD domain-containing protein [Kitasatospora sp. NPDC036755]|uniref:PKD domain-containing protein n=1 Tax=Kitasatospora sp. NPDC036755 TaxID=3154600 RepID=UPI0033D53BF5